MWNSLKDMTMTVEEFKNEMERLASIIDADKRLIPRLHDQPIEDELTVIIKDGLIEIVHLERGHLGVFISTIDSDEALYWVFRRMVQSKRSGESNPSQSLGLDKRRYWFKRDIELFLMIENSAWLEKRENEIEETLMKAPFKDGRESNSPAKRL